MDWINRIVAVILISACIVLWPETARFPGSAGEFPRLILILIGILATLLLVRSFMPLRVSTSTREGSRDPVNMIRPTAIFLLTAAIVYAMRFTGFFPGVLVLGVVYFFVLRPEKPIAYGATFLGLMVFTYLIFDMLLNVPLDSAELWGG